MGDHVAGVYPTRPAMPRCRTAYEILFGPELEALGASPLTPPSYYHDPTEGP